jgi:hypothetical protein
MDCGFAQHRPGFSMPGGDSRIFTAPGINASIRTGLRGWGRSDRSARADHGFAGDRNVSFGFHNAQIGREIHDSPNWSREMMNMVPIAIGLRNDRLKAAALETAASYGKVDVFHGDKTNCKIWDAVAALNDPRTKVKAP